MCAVRARLVSAGVAGERLRIFRRQGVLNSRFGSAYRNRKTTLRPFNPAFLSHSRRWRDLRYVYPVISRRSKGLSIGVNLNPDGACNFDCVYCSVDRTVEPRVRKVDLAVLETELRHLVETRDRLYDEPEFRDTSPEYRRLNDIAFSGNGEPTAARVFPDAARMVAAVRRDYRLDDAKIVVITNACYLTRPAVAATLALLDQHNGEIWAKLDAGTETYYWLVNRTSFPLLRVLDNIRAAGRVRPIVLQSLFMRIHGEPPTADEIAAWAGRIGWLLDGGAKIAFVQVYTVARRTTEPYATALTEAELEQIAEPVRRLGVPAACYP